MPIAAKRCRACTSVLTAIAIVLMLAAPSPASAQTNPAFVFAKPDEAKAGAPPPPPDKWNGKRRSRRERRRRRGTRRPSTRPRALSVSRKQNANKFAFDAAAAYGESNIIVPVFGDAANPTTITSLERRSTTTNNNWLTKARYDRFFTTNNAGYAVRQRRRRSHRGQVADRRRPDRLQPAAAQERRHTLVSEIGYDYSREHYVPQPMRTLAPVSIHSARLFVGETMKLAEASALTASFEAFFNLNRETAAINAQNRTVGVDPLHDTRLIGKLP